jgi:NAD(P)-dependent dehydrogenase (short-subunit alcohol dehydrogenase family)
LSKTILLVGAAGGVGLETARLLAARGYRIAATVLDAAQEALLRAEVPEIAAVLQLDLADADAIGPALQPLLAGAELEGAIVCAAIAPHGPLELTPLQTMRLVMEINTVAAAAVYQAVMPGLRLSKGRLILIGSHGGRVAFPFIGYYAASKFALEGLADVMRREAADFGVKIILIQPGGLQTGMTTGQLAKIDADIAALSGEAQALYGGFYKNFRGVLHGAAGQGTRPEVVAAAILGALEAPAPQTRYQVGQDSVDLVALSKSAPDEAIDAMFAQMFAAAGAA